MTVPADLGWAPRHRALGAGAGEGVVAVCAQLAPRLGDVRANLDTHHAVLADARDAGAHLVVFPELSLTGYFLRDLVPEVAVRLDGPELAELAGAAGHLDVVVGCVLETDDSRFLNAAVLLSGGRASLAHAKVYLPTYGLFDERRYMAPGNSIRALALPLAAASTSRPWRAGVLVCEDIWHPTAVSVLSREGIDLLVVPSASPGRGVGEGATLGTAQSYDSITRAHAQLTTSFVLYCNRTGYEDGVGFWGGSRLVQPDGELQVEPAGADEALAWFRLDRGAVRRARLATPLLRDARYDLIDREMARLRAAEAAAE